MLNIMADVIKFELSPWGNSNSLKFAHEHLLNQFFIDQGGNWTYRHRLLLHENGKRNENTELLLFHFKIGLVHFISTM